MPTRRTFTTHSENETVECGRSLAASLKAGSTVLLRGSLGAGKTTFVRGIAEGLGIDPTEVSSPTFLLIQEYRGPVTLYHVDLYRLEQGAAVEDLGLDDLTKEGGIAVIEWAERLPRSIPGAIQVTFEDGGNDTRDITVEFE